MQVKDMKIGTQLRLALGVLLILVVALGYTAWRQAETLWLQTHTMHNHPLTVRRAIGWLETDVVAIHRGMKDLFLAADMRETESILRDIEVRKADIARQFEILRERYLGPREDIERLSDEYARWNAVREETIRLLRSGARDEAYARTKPGGLGGAQAEVVLGHIKVIDDFSRNKAAQIYKTAKLEKDTLARHTLALAGASVLLAALVFWALLRSIRDPLKVMTAAADRFREGQLDTRVAYASGNELGTLSAALNALAETVEAQTRIHEQASELAAVMLRETEARAFCREMLKTLMAHTGSEIGAVYLMNAAQAEFEHFESIGMGEGGRASFSATALEGEFGSALATGAIRRVSAIPEDARFTFATVSGTFTPREIVTVPLCAEGRVSAVLSLASLRDYTPQAVRLLEVVQGMVAARMNGVLAFRQVQALAAKLDYQNRELEVQKQELTAQAGELTQQNTELEMQKRQLDEANRLKSSFLSNMSHELRTPLNSVIALSGVLTRRLAGVIPEEEHGYLDVIGRNGKHLLALINDILDLSRIEAGREEVAPARFGLRALVADVVAMVEPQSREKGLALVNGVPEGLPEIVSDADKCRHIFQNLIGNAIKFTDSGSVEVTARQEGGEICVAVRDTGIGIPEDQLAHIFEEFRQADNSASRKYGGTGLGLTIARRYATLLQGSVTVESEVGKGSTFTVRLPLELKAEAGVAEETAEGFEASGAAAGRGVAAAGCGQTILLVEDSEPAIIQMTDILSKNGYRVKVARNGHEALARIDEALPDGMILDLMMPEMDGFEVLGTIRGTEKAGRLPVLILTAKHVTRDELSFLKGNHVHQLIQKGDVSRNDLLAAVSRMVMPVPERAAVLPPRGRTRRTCEGTPRVLVVEDNPGNMQTMRALLQETCLLAEAANGQECLEEARRQRPDLILMDIQMPVMDGYAALAAIRADEALRDIPVVAVTASAMKGNRENILAYGFDGYVSKPIDEELLRTTMREVLYGHG